MGKRGHKVLSVAKSQYLAASLRMSPSLGRWTRKLRLGGSLCRWHRNSGSPTRGGWKKGGEVEEKLGRSRGGFSTKIHIRCEGQGKPLTFLLSPGQLMKSIFLEQYIIERAINRLKQFRRIATRYEKLAANYTAMITIACIWLWL